MNGEPATMPRDDAAEDPDMVDVTDRAEQALRAQLAEIARENTPERLLELALELQQLLRDGGD